MKISIRFVIVLTALIFGHFSLAEVVLPTNESKDSLFVICQRQKETRWLRAFKLNNGRCKTYYSKEGYVQVVSSASYFSSCEAVLGTVRKNIEEGGFKCSEKTLASMIEIE